MQRAMWVCAIVIFIFQQSPAGEHERVTIDENGSVRYRENNGVISKHSMDGKTPYGMEIEEIQKVVAKDDCIVELTYSKRFSDDIMNQYVESFYEELLQHTRDWLYARKTGNEKIRIIISNCAFVKTGYCKKTGKKRREDRFVEYVFGHPQSGRAIRG